MPAAAAQAAAAPTRSALTNLTSVSSHELVEAATDPAVGMATVIGPPLAWYDPNNGEIGDICNAQQGTTTIGNGSVYVIQLEFSNAANKLRRAVAPSECDWTPNAPTKTGSIS